MRLFVGIPLADGVVRELAAVVARLRGGASESRADGLRWTEPESWHITLQFLGNTTAEQLECLRSRLGEVRFAPSAVELGELGTFDRACILLVNVTMSPELADLQRRVVAATEHCEFVAETRPFHPHITLARTPGNKGPRGQKNKTAREHGSTLRELMAKAGKQPKFTGFTAKEFLLYESHLGRGGSRYEVRERFPLKGP